MTTGSSDRKANNYGFEDRSAIGLPAARTKSAGCFIVFWSRLPRAADKGCHDVYSMHRAACSMLVFAGRVNMKYLKATDPMGLRML